tara:strand:+ start:104 stop:223 length:120 start_codon:yes stop_codon:yes gene_type:complete
MFIAMIGGLETRMALLKREARLSNAWLARDEYALTVLSA